MQSGRKPKPPKLKLITGNPGKRPIPKAPDAPPVAPDEPNWRELLPDPSWDEDGDRVPKPSAKRIGDRIRRDARAKWREVVPVLDSLGLLSSIDATTLVDLCVCWARILQCERAISSNGLLHLTDRGYAKNPAITAAKGYRDQLKFHVSELGLSPSSRGRLPSGAGEESDDADVLD